jgi:hypothetical protein
MQQLKTIIQETIFETLTEELCAKGKAYIKARKAAGEKSSAYLSGRAVKVCKGLMEDNKEKVECKKCDWKWDLEDGGNYPYLCHKCGYDNSYPYDDSIGESLEDTIWAGYNFELYKGLMKSEEIDPSEASDYKGSINTVLNGKRNVGMVTLSFHNISESYFLNYMKNVGLEAIKVPSSQHNMYIFFKREARAKAEELKNIAEKYGGYLSAKATDDDTRRIGQILGYKKEAVEAYIKKHEKNKIESINTLTESLRNWFEKEDWVRIDTQGNITGPCGTMKKGKATTRCLPRAKANRLTKAQRASTARKKVAGSKKGKQFVPNTKKAKVKLRKK